MHLDTKMEKSAMNMLWSAIILHILLRTIYLRKNKYTENDVVGMLDFSIDNIFVECGGVIFQQIIGIHMGTNCAPLLADLFVFVFL